MFVVLVLPFPYLTLMAFMVLVRDWLEAVLLYISVISFLCTSSSFVFINFVREDVNLLRSSKRRCFVCDDVNPLGVALGKILSYLRHRQLWALLKFLKRRRL